MAGGERITVRAPGGERWQVRRRWLDWPLRIRRPEGGRMARQAGKALVEGIGLGDPLGGLFWPIAVLVAAIAIIVVLLPLLGVALELVAVLFFLAWGLFARLVLGRPWVVEAVPVSGDGEGRAIYAVKGWRASKEAVHELATTMEATGEPPQRLARGERLATRPAESTTDSRS